MDYMNVATLISAGRKLSGQVGKLKFSPPVTHVYNPLDYARAPYESYLTQFAPGKKRAVFLGMNPGPWGMAQTGIPFGEIPAVRDWMGICETVGKPPVEHPKRAVQGFACEKSEVSGRRLWGLFKERYGTAADFFREHFVLNYCPLVFMGETGANITPDKLPVPETEELFSDCDEHLKVFIRVLEPEFLVAVGNFAEGRLKQIVPDGVRLTRVLHPSPASPAANRDWAGTATRQLLAAGVWRS